MKNLKILIPLFIQISVLFPKEILATNYTHASHNIDHYTGVSCDNVKYTGNDVKYSASNSSFHTMHVWVGDDNFSSLAWDDGNSNTGNVLLDHGNGDIYDPDVSLVEDSNHNWWAIVVFYKAGDGYYYEFYEWDNTSAFIWDSEGQLASAASAGNDINIDANSSGHYAIVWDDANGNIYGSYGSTSTAPSTPSSATTIIAQSGSDYYYFPDVSIHGSNCYVTCVWTDYSYIDVYLDIFTLSLGSPSTWPNALTYGPYAYGDFDIKNTRIATPSSNCSNNDFTIVYQLFDIFINNIHIMGYSYTDYWSDKGLSDYADLYDSPNSCQNYHNYDATNYNPAVTYSSDYNGQGNGGIIVAWTISSATNDPGDEPIAVQCASVYGFITNCTYMNVPYSYNTSGGDIQRAISLSGRDNHISTPNIFYSWFDGVHGDVYYKDASFSYTDLRQETKENTQSISGIYPNPTNGNFQIKLGTRLGKEVNIEVYNSMGQKVYSSFDFSSSTSFVKDISLKNLEDGIFLIRVGGDQTTNNWKIILNK